MSLYKIELNKIYHLNNILINKIRFLRSSDDNIVPNETKNETWETRLAKKYEAKLYKNFGLIDLSHYKLGHVKQKTQF